MSEDKKMQIRITEDGPYVVTGGVPLSQDAIVEDPDGRRAMYSRVKDFEVGEEYHLCRCGHSKNKPFCDGTHKKIGFKGEETASREPYARRAKRYDGDAVYLLDDERCAYARFCHVDGYDVWTLTEASGGSDDLKRDAICAAWHCPTGRLESHDAVTGEVIEQHFEPSIIALEDTMEGASGPLFVRGGIPLVGADGFEYEVRNRYALCRCGSSQNKPFCDAMHINVHFDDGSPAFEGETGTRDESFDEWPEV